MICRLQAHNLPTAHAADLHSEVHKAALNVTPKRLAADHRPEGGVFEGLDDASQGHALHFLQQQPAPA